MSQAWLIRSVGTVDKARVLLLCTATIALLVIGIRAFFGSKKPQKGSVRTLRYLKLVKVLVPALVAWLVILFNLSKLHGQVAVTNWPQWLSLPEGVQAERTQSPGLISVSYRVQAKPEDSAKQLTAKFEQAKLPYSPQADGIGLTARVAAAECDLLLQFHPSQGGTQVKIHCAAKSAPVDNFYIPTDARSSRRASLESMRARNAHPQQQAADFERDSRANMAKYDQARPASSISFYNDDAPPLQWPAWLGRMDGQGGLRPERSQKDGKSCLVGRYTTSTVEMSKLVYGHEDLFRANGFQVPTMNLSTGHTWDGKIVQNKSGRVEGYLTPDGTVSGPSTKLTASFNRSVVNGPISVYLEVCVQGSFGRR